MIEKIKAKLANLEFRERILRTIIFVPAFRYLFTASFNVSKNYSVKFRNKMLLKYFFLQFILYIPYFIYNFYFYLFFVNGLKKNRRKIPLKFQKIGIYSPWFDKFAGGGEQVAAHLAEFIEFKYPNSEVEIICDDYSGVSIDKVAGLDEINIKYGTSLKRTKLNFYKNHFYSLYPLRYEKLFFKLTTNYDVFINCFMNSLPAFAAINLHYIHFPISKRDCKSKFQFENYRNAYDYFINNSEFTQNWTKKFFNIKNTKVIYPPVILPNLKSIPLKSNIILTAGRIDDVKCYEIMIDTFLKYEHLLFDYEFHFAGSLNPKNIEYFKKLKKRANSERIKFFTNLSFSDLQDKYKTAKFYWQSMGFGINVNKSPGKYEHFGITLVEAISYGCVPLVVEHGGPAEIVKNGNCGYIWKTKDELAEKTLFLINNQSLYDEFQRNCFISANNYKVDTFQREMGILMDSLIKEKP